MPESNEGQDVKRPAIYRINFACSTGYTPRPELRDYHNKVKAEAALRGIVKEAQNRQATWGEGYIAELYRDKETGRFAEQPNPVYAVYRFGKKS